MEKTRGVEQVDVRRQAHGSGAVFGSNSIKRRKTEVPEGWPESGAESGKAIEDRRESFGRSQARVLRPGFGPAATRPQTEAAYLRQPRRVSRQRVGLFGIRLPRIHAAALQQRRYPFRKHLCQSGDLRILGRPQGEEFRGSIPGRIRSVKDFSALPETEQGAWIEWLVAQELTRRRAIAGQEMPHEIPYWQAGGHEIDFVLSASEYLEVKRGGAGPLDFSWFPSTHPKARLRVVCTSRFRTDSMESLSFEEFMLET